MEIYYDILYDIIKTMVKRCDSFQGLLKGGVLILIVNNGIVYTIDLSDRIPLDITITTYYNAGRGDPNYEYDPILENQIKRRIIPLSINPFDTPIYYNSEFDTNPTFELMRNSNTTEGGFKLLLDLGTMDYMIITILYKGVFNLNKKDRISLQVFDKDPVENPGYSLLFEYTIYKDKLKKEYKISYLTFNLWRRLHDITS